MDITAICYYENFAEKKRSDQSRQMTVVFRGASTTTYSLHTVLDRKGPNRAIVLVFLSLDSCNVNCFSTLNDAIGTVMKFTIDFIKSDVDNKTWYANQKYIAVEGFLEHWVVRER